MGDLKVCPPQPRGGEAAAAAAGCSATSPHPPNPRPSTIGDSIWRQAEQATLEIIQHIQPTVVSEQRRKAVVEYVQKLIRGFLSCEVFPFGSVPLKTYLPDGDIDLTAIGIPSSEDTLALDVRSVLEGEEHNKDAEFEVKDVQFIHAEVKLVKCLVQNIVVDISFNQIGGLCTLCFLEQVDRLIGKDHLFKRSIILIKAWCYYESRILGAHHGLISTYALETLVLYIFHLFHSSLEGPLAVLYMFLDYYSKFDWDKYCISLRGPVAITSLPELSVETSDNDGGDLLLTEEFLRSCVDTFTVPVRGSESNSRTFTKKHLNIVDPLRESNNLGRSVSKGNFYRIRSAFAYGARKLGRTLLLPTGSIVREVNLFFMNTMDRHGGGERPDVQDLLSRLLGSESVESNGIDIVPPVEKLQKQKAYKLSAESHTANVYRDLNKEMKVISISGLEEYEGKAPLQRTFSHIQQNGTEVGQSSVEVSGISSGRLVGDAKDLATARNPVSGMVSESHQASASNKDDDILDVRKAHHAPHMFFLPENRTRRDLSIDPINSTSLGTSNFLSNRALNCSEEITNSMQTGSCETDSSSCSTYLVNNYGCAPPSKTSHFADCDLEVNKGNGFNGRSCLLNEMSDLSGDYEMNLSCLMYAQWCQEQIISTYFLPFHQLPPYSYYHRCKDVRTNGTMFTPMNSNALSSQPIFSPTAYYSRNPPFISANYGTEDSPKPRGTGTYLPNTNYHVYRERHFPGRIKNAVSANNLPRIRNSGRADVSQDMSPTEKGSHEPAIPALPIFNGRGRPPALLHIPQSSSRPSFKAPSNANGIIFPADCSKLEFGSLGPVSVEVPISEHGRKPDFSIAHGQGSGFTSTTSNSQRTSMNSSRGRMSKSYQLKDEDDFPPLSS